LQQLWVLLHCKNRIRDKKKVSCIKMPATPLREQGELNEDKGTVFTYNVPIFNQIDALLHLLI
jgi:hypothetical protein